MDGQNFLAESPFRHLTQSVSQRAPEEMPFWTSAIICDVRFLRFSFASCTPLPYRKLVALEHFLLDFLLIGFGHHELANHKSSD